MGQQLRGLHLICTQMLLNSSQANHMFNQHQERGVFGHLSNGDEDFRNLLRLIFPPEHMKISITAITNVPYVRKTFEGILGYGPAGLAGRFSILVASKNGQPTKGLQPHVRMYKVVNYLLRGSGGVLAAISLKIRCLKSSRVGVKKRLTRSHYPVYHHSLVVRHVRDHAIYLKNVRIHAHLCVIAGHVLLVLRWGLRGIASVERSPSRGDALILIMRMGGAVVNRVVRSCPVVTTSAQGHAMKACVVPAKFVYLHVVVAGELRKKYFAATEGMKKKANAHILLRMGQKLLNSGLDCSSVVISVEESLIAGYITVRNHAINRISSLHIALGHPMSSLTAPAAKLG